MSSLAIYSLCFLTLCSLSSQSLFADEVEDDSSPYSALDDESPVYSSRALSPVSFMRHRRASRMCGEVLTRAMQAVCDGCVKPPGTIVFEKRSSDIWRPKRDEKVTDKCCKEKCSMDYLKKFCC